MEYLPRERNEKQNKIDRIVNFLCFASVSRFRWNISIFGVITLEGQQDEGTMYARENPFFICLKSFSYLSHKSKLCWFSPPPSLSLPCIRPLRSRNVLFSFRVRIKKERYNKTKRRKCESRPYLEHGKQHTTINREEKWTMDGAEERKNKKKEGEREGMIKGKKCICSALVAHTHTCTQFHQRTYMHGTSFVPHQQHKIYERKKKDLKKKMNKNAWIEASDMSFWVFRPNHVVWILIFSCSFRSHFIASRPCECWVCVCLVRIALDMQQHMCAAQCSAAEAELSSDYTTCSNTRPSYCVCYDSQHSVRCIECIECRSMKFSLWYGVPFTADSTLLIWKLYKERVHSHTHTYTLEQQFWAQNWNETGFQVK